MVSAQNRRNGCQQACTKDYSDIQRAQKDFSTTLNDPTMVDSKQKDSQWLKTTQNCGVAQLNDIIYYAIAELLTDIGMVNAHISRQ